ncbi:unnamed protein product [Discosporangium mesarthrocarpum]
MRRTSYYLCAVVCTWTGIGAGALVVTPSIRASASRTWSRAAFAGTLPPKMIAISLASDKDIPDVASFFVNSFWDEEIQPGQAQALRREQTADLEDRYGERVGSRKLPSALVAAKKGNELVGCVGIEVMLCEGEVSEVWCLG